MLILQILSFGFRRPWIYAFRGVFQTNRTNRMWDRDREGERYERRRNGVREGGRERGLL
jgi:hypothetical protein